MDITFRKLPLCGLAILLCLSGCSAQGGRMVQSTLAPFGLASSVAVDHESRWRLPSTSRVTVVAVTPAPYADWLHASVAGLQSRFPVTGPAEMAGVKQGLTVYVQWPSADGRAQEVAPSAIATIPQRAWEIISHTPSERIGVVCVDNVSRAVVHRAQLRVHASWRHSSSHRTELIRAAFSRYAGALASG